jgi:hypothetical protein
MARKRGSSHTTLTETARLVTKVLETIPGVKMIAPGIIDAKRSGARFITAVLTTAGIEFIISGQGVQKIAVHTTSPADTEAILLQLQNHKQLQQFKWNVRVKKPGS